MFHHSIKVPRLYKVAAKIAKDVKEGRGSIKQLVYENQKKHPRIKPLYALVATLFQRSEEIENLLKRSQFLVKEPRSDPWLIKVLIVELLWGSKRLAGESKPEKTVLAYEQIFKAHLNDIPVASMTNDSSKVEIKPRYVRVNTLLASLNEAVDGFRDEGWSLCKFLDKSNYKEFLSKITSLAEDEFLIDIHIPNLLIFPPKTEFFKHPAYKNGSIILQDKASCLPVHILAPPPGSIVLDMCAAPGMKTTQVAAAICNEGTVYAVERDPRRFETLNKIIESSGATCVKTLNRDVLACNGGDFPGVQFILVDPSCTGSGMTERLQYDQEERQYRIQNLAGFQIKILRSALTRYPDAKRVVYSTCSIFQEENEDVVRQVLETNTRFKLVPAKQFVNDAWKNFGSTDFGDIGNYCLYAKPNEDFTNGFFVAVFERLEEGEENTFFNTKIYNYKKHIESQEKRRNKKQQDQNYNTPVSESVEEFEQDKKHTFKIANEHTSLENTVDDSIDGSAKRKKKKKAKSESIENGESSWVENNTSVEGRKKKILDNICEENALSANKNQPENCGEVCKKKKKRNSVDVDEQVIVIAENTEQEKKNKNKRKLFQNEVVENCDEESAKKVKRKKKKKDRDVEHVETVTSIDPYYGENVKKKKKQREYKQIETKNDVVSIENENQGVPAMESISKKKKKKRKESEVEYLDDVNGHSDATPITKKKKKSDGHEKADDMSFMETKKYNKKKKSKTLKISDE